jgi:thymidine kinase
MSTINNLNNEGSLIVYVGCMFSGKSSEIIKQCRRHLIIGQRVLGINYLEDKRYTDEDFIVNHNLEKVHCVKVKYLKDVDNSEILNNDFIFIDEGQFFGDLLEYVNKWVNEYKKSVCVFGLDGDFKREPFGDILKLIPQCNEVIKLKALCIPCKNGTEALFTHRLSSENEQVVIGNSNYIPVCRKHYNELNKETEEIETY